MDVQKLIEEVKAMTVVELNDRHSLYFFNELLNIHFFDS